MRENSVAFVKSRTLSGQVSNWVPKDGWDDSLAYDPFDCIAYAINTISQPCTKHTLIESGALKGDVLTLTMTVEDKTRSVKICFDPDYQSFEYVRFDQTTHDGTLLFAREAIAKLALELMQGNTYNIATAPAGFADNYMDYDLEYTVGAILEHTEFDHFNNRGWLEERDTLAIPIAVRYILHDKGEK